MLAIAIFVAGLVIALSWAAVRRSDIEDVPASNKPSDDGIDEIELQL